MCVSSLGLDACRDCELTRTRSFQWQYFVPIQEGMPKNCSKDLARLVEHVDRVLASGYEKTKQQLKDKFQVGSLQDDDFAEYVLPCSEGLERI